MEAGDSDTERGRFGVLPAPTGAIATTPAPQPQGSADLDPVLASAIEGLIERVTAYNPRADPQFLHEAALFACAAHRGELREDGTPYIWHLVATANTLAELEMDQAAVVAGLLHDILENTRVTQDELERRFGNEIATLVDGVTKLGDGNKVDRPGEGEESGKKRRQSARKRHAENLQKLLLAMSRDLRVIIIKLADRLHNMQTLQHLASDRQERIARETLEVYAPLAHRLGIWHLKWQLEDLAFRFLMPEQYEDVARKVAKTRAAREGEITRAIEALRERLNAAGIEAEIQGRPKHLYSIYLKMQTQELDFSDIYDLMAIRVIVHTESECYRALGMVHELWMPIHGLFADYIARPKPNNYRSLHTKVVGPTGEPMEVQIRTWAMHRTAEFGVAAHWRYKEGGKADAAFEERLATLRQRLFEWHCTTRDSQEFLRWVMEDLLADQVFVFTPKGEVIGLPTGSTPVDFAYRIHSDLGDHCVGAKVNGRLVPLDYQFRNADVVHIITRSTGAPSLDWLAFVKTATARNRIKRYLRRLTREDDILRGREQIERELERRNLERIDASKHERVAEVAAEMNYQSREDLLAAVGHGLVSARTVVDRLKLKPPVAAPAVAEQEAPAERSEPSKIAIHVGGQNGLLMRLGKCCSPIPGDAVAGYISRGRGIVIHRVDCVNAIKYYQREPERLMPVDWQESRDATYPARLQVLVVDRVGVLNAITGIVSEARVNISQLKVQTEPNRTGWIDLTLEVRSTDHLATLMRRIDALNDVLEVRRAEPRYRRGR